MAHMDFWLGSSGRQRLRCRALWAAIVIEKGEQDFEL